MGDLKIVKFPQTTDERIQNRIDSFCNEFMQQDGTMTHAQNLLQVIDDYLCQFEGEEIYHAAYKIKEAIFYIDLSMCDE